MAMKKEWMNMVGFTLTILTILGTFIFTQGRISNKIESFEKDINTNSVRVNKNQSDINNINIAQAKMDTKLDAILQRFDIVETLIVEN